jgi:metabolite-proton symporter
MATNQLEESKRRTVFRVVSGNFLEMFDFMVYGFYASAIAAAIFPSDNEFVSLILSLATFGVGFLMRPLGALVLGAYIDRKGRRAGLILSLALMSAGVMMIAFVPSYHTIGIAAPIIVVVGRLLQGFSAGAESGGVSVYLAEIAPPGKMGFYVSWQSASQQVAVVFAAVLGVGLGALLTPEQMTSWGWRIPFMIGCLIIPFLFAIRRSLQETEVFKAQKHRPTGREIMRSLAENWKIVFGGVMLVTLTSVMFYLITAYTPTYARNVLKLQRIDSFVVTVCVGLSNFVWVPVMGALSDKVGRRPVLTVFSFIILATAYPAMAWLVKDPSFSHLLMVELWFSFLYGSYQGALVVSLVELMPANVRSTGFSLAYSLAQAIFGGFTPAICTYLIHATGNNAMPGVWLSVAAAIALIATFMMFPAQGKAVRPVRSVTA